MHSMLMKEQTKDVKQYAEKDQKYAQYVYNSVAIYIYIYMGM